MRYEIDIAGTIECEVAVAGGGMAGTMAALAAGRAGADTVLIEEQAFVGGQATAGGVHSFCGETRLVNNVWRDMIDRLGTLGGVSEYRPNADGRAFDCEALKFVLQEMLLEAGVRPLLHTRFVDVERDGNTVNALILHNKSGFTRLICHQVIDATGDADVIAQGGWEYLRGGPVLKPGDNPELDADSPPRQLPMSLYFTMVQAAEGERVSPVLPLGCPTYRDDEDLPMITVIQHGRTVAVKMKVIGFDATVGTSISEAEQAARRQMMGVVYHLQTKGFRGKTYPDHKLAWVFPHIGIREGRRVVAQYVLAAEDVLRGRHFSDVVAVGSYHIDYHWPNVVQRAGTGVTTQCPPYQIPFRSMRPKDTLNILVAGRCLSGEQMAMSSYRVMGICAQTGFAAGSAAALAIRDGISLDSIDQTDLRCELRKHGVRLDLSPYYSYLRRRRGVQENPAQVDADNVGGLGLALLPDGDIIAAWSALVNGRWHARVIIRHEERWSEPRTVGEAAEKIMVSTNAAHRNIFDRCDAHTVREDESPVVVYVTEVETGDWAYSSTDGGASWSKQTGRSDAANQDEGSVTDAVQLASAPGDRQVTVRPEGGSLRIIEDDNASRSRLFPVESLDDRVRPAIIPSADGLAILYIAKDGALVFRRISLDVLTSGDSEAADWHHSDSGWVKLIAEGVPSG